MIYQAHLAMTPHETARAKLEDQRLPPLVLEIFEGTAELAGLEYRCQSPHHVFATSPESLRNFVPMWECGVVATGLDLSDGRFVKLSLEDPDAPWMRFSKFSHLVADLLIVLWEDEIEDPALEELARKFEFEGLARLLEDLNDGALVSHEDHEEWRRTLVMSF